MAEVLLRDVVKKYDSVDAVKRLNLCCNDKEFLVLLGPSGCGKSSTLRMIAGLEDITQGQISIDGVVVNDIHPSKRDIAMVFETYALYPHKTVFDNMAYPLRVRKTPGPEIDQKVRRAAEILEIEGFLDRYPRQLSGGQKQRVAIGRAIVREPKVFLMDEPISHLDAKLRSHMRGELKHLHKELNQTFIYVSHDQTEAMAMADRIAVMNLGVLQQFDTPQNIFNKPVNTFVAGFVGDPPMNFLPSLLTQSGDKWVLKFDGFTLKVSEKIRSQIIASGTKFQQDMEVILGARPEHVILKTEKTGEEDMAGQIYITEPLGSYMIVDVMLGGERIKVRTDVGFDVQPDDRVFVELPSDKIQLFDAKTSYSIIHPRSSTECEAG